MNITDQISAAVRNTRLRLEMTRDEVAAAADISPGTLSALENGRLENLSLATAERILTAVGLELGLALRGKATPLLLPEVTKKRVRRSA